MFSGGKSAFFLYMSICIPSNALPDITAMFCQKQFHCFIRQTMLYMILFEVGFKSASLKYCIFRIVIHHVLCLILLGFFVVRVLNFTLWGLGFFYLPFKMKVFQKSLKQFL